MIAYVATLKRHLSSQICLKSVILLLSCRLFGLCECVARDLNQYGGNVTSTHLRFRDFEPRSGSKTMTNLNFNRLARGFQFYTTPEDLIMEMEFIVPFIKIPIERSTQLSQAMLRNLMNLNGASLVSTGAIVAIGAAVASAVKLLTTPQFVYNPGGKKRTRALNGDKLNTLFSLDSKETNLLTNMDDVWNFNSFTNFIDTKLKNNDVDVSVCIQRWLCHYLSTTSSAAKASSTAKIVDGLMNLEATRSFLNGSTVEHIYAVAKGLQNCDTVFQKCKRSNLFNTLMNYLELISK